MKTGGGPALSVLERDQAIAKKETPSQVKLVIFP
jgi:hypothetical protein